MRFCDNLHGIDEQELDEILPEVIKEHIDGAQHGAQSEASDDLGCPTNIPDTTKNTILDRFLLCEQIESSSAQLGLTDGLMPIKQDHRHQLAQFLAPLGVDSMCQQDIDEITYKPFQGAYLSSTLNAADDVVHAELEREKAVILSSPSLAELVHHTRSGLPVAHIKRIAKQEACLGIVPKLSASFVPTMAHAVRIFVKILTARAHQFMMLEGRSTMQMRDIVMAIDSCEKLDFLIDVIQQCAPMEVENIMSGETTIA